jgi:hypothetical protein
MTTDDLASDIRYLETMAQATAQASAALVSDVADLKARLERLPAIVTDVRIGPGDYHACPRDLAPMDKLGAIVAAGGLVLVEDSSHGWYRLLAYVLAEDVATITPIRGEIGRRMIPKAGKWVYGYVIYLKMGA